MMRRNKNRLFIAVAVILCVLSLASCRKGDGAHGFSLPKLRVPTSAPVVETSVPQPSAPQAPAVPSTPQFVPSTATTVLVSYDEQKEAPRPEVIALSEVEETPASIADELYFSQVYRGGRFLIRGDFYNTHADLNFSSMTEKEVMAAITALVEKYPFLLEEMSYSFDGTGLVLSYDTKEESDVRDYWFAFVDFMDSLNGSGFFSSVQKDEVAYNLTDDKAYVFLTPYAQERVPQVLSEILQSAPEAYSSVSYTLSDGLLILTSSAPVEDAEARLQILKAKLEEPVVEDVPEETVEEMIPEAASEPEETKVEERKAEVSVPVVPVTKAGIKIREQSASVYLKGGIDFTPSASFGLGVKYDARISENLSLGFKVETIRNTAGRFIPLMATARWDFDNELYVFGGIGVNIGLGEAKTGIVLEGGVGYQKEFSELLMGYVEGGLRITTGKPYAGLFVNVGGRYTF